MTRLKYVETIWEFIFISNSQYKDKKNFTIPYITLFIAVRGHQRAHGLIELVAY